MQKQKIYILKKKAYFSIIFTFSTLDSIMINSIDSILQLAPCFHHAYLIVLTAFQIKKMINNELVQTNMHAKQFEWKKTINIHIHNSMIKYIYRFSLLTSTKYSQARKSKLIKTINFRNLIIEAILLP